jgi:hypothetical protein
MGPLNGMVPSGFGVIFCMRVLTKSNGRLHALAKKPARGSKEEQQQSYVSKESHSSHALAKKPAPNDVQLQEHDEQQCHHDGHTPI